VPSDAAPILVVVREGDEYLRRGVAEFIGAFALVFVGGGAAVDNDPLSAAFANGLVIAVFVTAFAGISGGHFNPAVTFGFLVTKRIPAPMAAFYWASQLAGGLFAALLLKWIFPASLNALHLGAPALNPAIDSGKGVVIEAILTFFLVLVFFATAVDPRGAFDKIAGLAIGLTIVLDVTMGASFTGAAMNPARAFGPELASGHWANFWVWIVGPLAGGALAAILYDVLYLGRVPPEPEPATVAEVDDGATAASA
jgi:aquaporin Z